MIWHFLITASLMGALAVSLNLAVGSAGLFNIGHAAYFGVGAYTSALLVLAGVRFELALPGAAVVAGILGLALGGLTLKLEGDYFAVASLGLGIVTQAVLNNWQGLTRGPMGIPGIPAPAIFGVELNTLPAQFFLAAFYLVLVYLTVERLTRSPFGLSLRAVRDDEAATAALGKPVVALKVQAAAVSALFAGGAGSLYAHYVSYIDPSQFGLALSVSLLVAVIFGGLGNHLGAILAATLLVGMQQGLLLLGVPPGLSGGLQQLLFSVALVALVLMRPRGLLAERRWRAAFAPPSPERGVRAAFSNSRLPVSVVEEGRNDARDSFGRSIRHGA